MSVTIHLQLPNGDLLHYDAEKVVDPADEIGRVKLVDHLSDLRKKITTHLDLAPLDIHYFVFPHEIDDMIHLYFHKFETDSLFRTKTFIFEMTLDNIKKQEGVDMSGGEHIYQHFDKLVPDLAPTQQDNILREKDDVLNQMPKLEKEAETQEEKEAAKLYKKKSENLSIGMMALISSMVDTSSARPKDEAYLRQKLSDRSSMFYRLMYSELLETKLFTEDVTLDVIIDHTTGKEMMNIAAMIQTPTFMNQMRMEENSAASQCILS